MGNYEYTKEPKEASQYTKDVNTQFLSQYNMEEFDENHHEYEQVNYGLLYRPEDLYDEDFDLREFRFLGESTAAPESVNPSLWAMGRANLNPGVYSVRGKDIIQVRGLVVGNVTLIRGKTGWIIMDCLYPEEAGKAGVKLAEKYLGENIRDNISAVIVSYAVTDVYGNIKGGLHGILSDEELEKIPVYGPRNAGRQFTLENTYTNVVNMRREAFQFGAGAAPSPQGYITLALGIGSKKYRTMGTHRVTHTIEKDGYFEVDGLKIYAQLAPDVGAPPELNLYFEDYRALWAGEFLCNTLHNIYPLRGSKVRDANKWAKYLTELADLYGDKTDVIFQNVNWPHVNTENWPTAVKDYLLDSAAAYKLIHDETLRLAGKGLRIEEIAKRIKYPKSFENRLAVRPYYGSIEAGVRGVYTSWLGSYDGNPMYIKGQTKYEKAEQFIEYAGGVDEVLEKALNDFENGRYQRAIEALDNILFVDKDHERAKYLEADAFEQLAYQSENGTLRNSYLTAARELRYGIQVRLPEKDREAKGDFLKLAENMPSDLTLDYLGISLDAEKSGDDDIVFQWIVEKEKPEYWIVHIYKGTLLYSKGKNNLLPYVKSAPGVLMAAGKKYREILDANIETNAPEIIEKLFNNTENLLDNLSYPILWGSELA